MSEEFNLKKELEKIFEKELLGKILSAGRIYRKLRARDKEFIKRLKEKEKVMKIPKGAIGGRGGEFIKVIESCEIDKLAGDKLK